MAAFKNKTNGTWYVQFRYTDWKGERQQKLKYKEHVEVIPVDYRYSFGNQGDAKTHRNSVQEYLFVGF